MGAPELEMKHRQAGAEYLSAIQRLGLNPDALLWAFDEVVGSFVLVLVTSFFDLKGPYEISKLLFKAYNAFATPQEIDPFVIQLHSPNHAIVESLIRWAEGGTVQKINPRTLTLEGPKAEILQRSQGGLTVNKDWIYKLALPQAKPYSMALVNRWNRFQRNVDRLAA